MPPKSTAASKTLGRPRPRKKATFAVPAVPEGSGQGSSRGEPSVRIQDRTDANATSSNVRKRRRVGIEDDEQVAEAEEEGEAAEQEEAAAQEEAAEQENGEDGSTEARDQTPEAVEPGQGGRRQQKRPRAKQATVPAASLLSTLRLSSAEGQAKVAYYRYLGEKEAAAAKKHSIDAILSAQREMFNKEPQVYLRSGIPTALIAMMERVLQDGKA